ncbi:MAG: hypothetical protein HQL62_03075 [Magnetococcales bacterium]|nr:hypothetical protein [Magnetococcales bacterium]
MKKNRNDAPCFRADFLMVGINIACRRYLVLGHPDPSRKRVLWRLRRGKRGVAALDPWYKGEGRVLPEAVGWIELSQQDKWDSMGRRTT